MYPSNGASSDRRPVLLGCYLVKRLVFCGSSPLPSMDLRIGRKGIVPYTVRKLEGRQFPCFESLVAKSWVLF